MSWEELIAIASILISIAAIVISVIYSRPQAQLAKVERERELAEHLSQHYQELLKWFFEQINYRYDPTKVQENALHSNLQKLQEDINELEYMQHLKKHYENGLLHTKEDNEAVYKQLISIKEEITNLLQNEKELDQKINRVFDEILVSIPDLKSQFQSDSLPFNRNELIKLVAYDLGKGLDKSSVNKSPDISSLTQSLPVARQFHDENTYVIYSDSEVVMRILSKKIADDVFDIIWKLEKNQSLIREIIRIRTLKLNLKRSLEQVQSYSQGVKSRIMTNAYSVRVKCCPKA